MKLTPNHGRWGILGGMFDPVHRGHLALAGEMCEQKLLAGVLFVPSIRHPFKRGRCQASFADRVKMLKLAVENSERFLVSEIETELRLSGYTVETIRALKQQYPRTEFFFIIGADNLGELNQWYNPQQILREVRILVGSRPPYDKRQLADYPPDRIELVSTSLIDVSSTEIRKKIRDNISLDQLDSLIPPKVREYIQQKKLYQ